MLVSGTFFLSPWLFLLDSSGLAGYFAFCAFSISFGHLSQVCRAFGCVT